MANLLLLNGPNLNLLGSREPETYGSDTLENIVQQLSKMASDNNHSLDHLQSNAEHVLVDKIHQAKKDKVEFILFNPAAFTHTSIALRDALLGTEIPFIEVHLSNVYKREEFRKHSFFSDISVGTIIGLGAQGYELALQAAIHKLEIHQ